MNNFVIYEGFFDEDDSSNEPLKGPQSSRYAYAFGKNKNNYGLSLNLNL